MGNVDDRICFLLGPGRSGTTLLYKLLCLHPEIAYTNNYMAKLGGRPELAVLDRLIRQRPNIKKYAWFDARGGAYADSGRPWLRKVIPTPSECEPLYIRCGVPDTPAPGECLSDATLAELQRSFSQIRRLSGGNFVLSKRTANNRRIPQLNQAFPSAKYIVLIRDGRAVASSLVNVNWWRDHILYWNGNSPNEATKAGLTELELAAMNWVHEMNDLLEGIQGISNARRLEVRYERLLNNPVHELDRIAAFLRIKEFSSTGARRTIDELQIASRPESWRKQWSDDELRRVHRIEHEMLTILGYLPDNGSY